MHIFYFVFHLHKLKEKMEKDKEQAVGKKKNTSHIQWYNPIYVNVYTSVLHRILVALSSPRLHGQFYIKVLKNVSY